MTNWLDSVEHAQATLQILNKAHSGAYRSMYMREAEPEACMEAVKTIESARRKCLDEAIEKFGRPEVPGCRYCGEISVTGGFGPSHHGSRLCRCGSLASGGRRSHCTCDTCF